MSDTQKIKDCLVNQNDVDLVPECYHYSSKCLCFLCTCGQHQCPSLKRSFFAKGCFSSNYTRSYSKPQVSQQPHRVQTDYHPNTNKMDLKTEYMKEFIGRSADNSELTRSQTPQPLVKFEGKTQYSRDYPNWGPVEYYKTKGPINPIHETKLKFEGSTSYNHYYQLKPSVSTSFRKIDKKDQKKLKNFSIPLQTTTLREFKPFSNEHLARHERVKSNDFVPVQFNPHQFKTVANTSYVPVKKVLKSPSLYRKEMLAKEKPKN